MRRQGALRRQRGQRGRGRLARTADHGHLRAVVTGQPATRRRGDRPVTAEQQQGGVAGAGQRRRGRRVARGRPVPAEDQHGPVGRPAERRERHRHQGRVVGGHPPHRDVPVERQRSARLRPGAHQHERAAAAQGPVDLLPRRAGQAQVGIGPIDQQRPARAAGQGGRRGQHVGRGRGLLHHHRHQPRIVGHRREGRPGGQVGGGRGPERPQGPVAGPQPLDVALVQPDLAGAGLPEHGPAAVVQGAHALLPAGVPGGAQVRQSHHVADLVAQRPDHVGVPGRPRAHADVGLQDLGARRAVPADRQAAVGEQVGVGVGQPLAPVVEEDGGLPVGDRRGRGGPAGERRRPAGPRLPVPGGHPLVHRGLRHDPVQRRAEVVAPGQRRVGKDHRRLQHHGADPGRRDRRGRRDLPVLIGMGRGAAGSSGGQQPHVTHPRGTSRVSQQVGVGRRSGLRLLGRPIGQRDDRWWGRVAEQPREGHHPEQGGQGSGDDDRTGHDGGAAGYPRRP